MLPISERRETIKKTYINWQIKINLYVVCNTNSCLNDIATSYLHSGYKFCLNAITVVDRENLFNHFVSENIFVQIK